MGERVLLDNRRTPCAVGLIKAARLMADLADGTVLEIWSRDRFAPFEIPIWADADGHAVRALGKQGHWPAQYLVFEVTKGAAPPPSAEDLARRAERAARRARRGAPTAAER